MADLGLSPNVLALAKVVAIQSVRFTRTTTEFLGVQAGDVLDKLQVAAKSGGLRSPDDPAGIRAFIGVECAILRTDMTRAAGKFTCELALDYKVGDAALLERLSEQDLTQFAASTGVYNAWPYIREFCHSASLRMGLPVPLILPTLPLAFTQMQAPPESPQAPISPS